MISAKPWSLEAVARLFLGVITSIFLGVSLAGFLEMRKTGMAPEQLQFFQMMIMICFFQGAALVWVNFFLRKSNLSWREAFGLRPPGRAGVVASGVAVGLAVLPVMWLLQMLSQMLMEWAKLQPVAQPAVEELQNSGLTGLEKILFAVGTILLAPAAEEALFRGILYPTIKQAGHPRWALWGTSLAFGIMHFNLASMTSLILLAVLLVLLYEATGSLLAPLAMHSVFNAANYLLLVFPDAVDRLLHLL